jgi:hypothetical protein
LLDAALDMEGQVDGTEPEGWVMDQAAMRGMFMVIWQHFAVTCNLVKFGSKMYNYFDQDLLVTGSGSTTSTIEWAMAELLLHPRCMHKVQDELRRVLGERPHVAESDISNCEYKVDKYPFVFVL